LHKCSFRFAGWFRDALTNRHYNWCAYAQLALIAGGIASWYLGVRVASATLWITAGVIGIGLAILIWTNVWGARAATQDARIAGRAAMDSPGWHAAVLATILGILPIVLGVAQALGAS